MARVHSRHRSGEGGARQGSTSRKYCVGCHETWTTDGQMREYKLFALAEVGTDPLTALNYERLVQRADGDVKPFPYAAHGPDQARQDGRLPGGRARSADDRRVGGRATSARARAGIRRSARRCSTRRNGTTRRAGRCTASKTLVGIWATAPYLHNGSVPTIYDLLLPAAQRPRVVHARHARVRPGQARIPGAIRRSTRCRRARSPSRSTRASPATGTPATSGSSIRS